MDENRKPCKVSVSVRSSLRAVEKRRESDGHGGIDLFRISHGLSWIRAVILECKVRRCTDFVGDCEHLNVVKWMPGRWSRKSSDNQISFA